MDGTPRTQLRTLLTGGASMNDAERYVREGVISWEAFDRFERLWAITTATEHRRTAHMSLTRWRSRRDVAGAALLSASLADLRVVADAGEPVECTLAEFWRDNRDGFSPAERIDVMRALRSGRVYHGGGGAAADFTISPVREA